MLSGNARTVLLIVGMKSNACREIVAGALELVHGIREAHVNLHRGRAVVTHDPKCRSAELIAAVERAGYGASIASQVISRRPSWTGRADRVGSGDDSMKETPR